MQFFTQVSILATLATMATASPFSPRAAKNNTASNPDVLVAGSSTPSIPAYVTQPTSGVTVTIGLPQVSSTSRSHATAAPASATQVPKPSSCFVDGVAQKDVVIRDEHIVDKSIEGCIVLFSILEGCEVHNSQLLFSPSIHTIFYSSSLDQSNAEHGSIYDSTVQNTIIFDESVVYDTNVQHSELYDSFAGYDSALSDSFSFNSILIGVSLLLHISEEDTIAVAEIQGSALDNVQAEFFIIQLSEISGDSVISLFLEQLTLIDPTVKYEQGDFSVSIEPYLPSALKSTNKSN
ncbi:hypothetical protein B7463_g9727, partial [Scytalidium lignicola]